MKKIRHDSEFDSPAQPPFKKRKVKRMTKSNAEAVIRGHILRDPEMKRFKGRDVCIFTVVVDTGKKNKDTDTEVVNFFDCSVWGEKAQIWYEKLAKGTDVMVVGSFYQHEYKKESGTKYRLRLEVASMKLLPQKKVEEEAA